MNPLIAQNNSNTYKHVKSPAYSYGVVSKDRVLYSELKGEINISCKKAINKQSQFALFSITKIFTAIATLQLAESKKINLQDCVYSYLPHYSFLGDIRVKDLLSHQSGINNPMPMKWIHLAEEDDDFDFEHFNKKTLDQKTKIKFKARTKAAYSNLNYILLGELITKITKLPYRKYIEEHVLNSKEISFQWKKYNTVTGYHKAGIHGLILSLLVDKDKYTNPKSSGMIPFKNININGSAHGGLLASSEGMNDFLQEFLQPDSTILSKNWKAKMFASQPLTNGKSSGHSLGWFTGSLKGHSYVHHPGGGGGFYAELRIYPGLNLASYLLTNSSGFTDKKMLDSLDSRFIPELL